MVVPERRPRMKKAGRAMTRAPSTAKRTTWFIADLCSTARAREKGNHRSPAERPWQGHARDRTDVGREMERANYKGRFNLRVSLATAEKLCGGERERKPPQGLGHRSFAALGWREHPAHLRGEALHRRGDLL